MNNIMILLKTDNYSDVPRLLLDKITSDEAGDFLEQFTQKDQGNDALRDFFQERYAARKDLKQDYTPDCLGKLINKLTGDSAKVLDMCAGTGALTIHGSQSAEFFCEELSGDVIPFLLFNLAFRNMKATVLQKNILTGEIIAKYSVAKGEKYGVVSQDNI